MWLWLASMTNNNAWMWREHDKLSMTYYYLRSLFQLNITHQKDWLILAQFLIIEALEIQQCVSKSLNRTERCWKWVLDRYWQEELALVLAVLLGWSKRVIIRGHTELTHSFNKGFLNKNSTTQSFDIWSERTALCSDTSKKVTKSQWHSYKWQTVKVIYEKYKSRGKSWAYQSLENWGYEIE